MWDIDSTSDLLRKMSAASEPHDVLQLILAHARRGSRLERAIVLSREGLDHPFFRVSFQVRCDAGDACEILEGAGAERCGGLLAELLYAGRFHCTSSLRVGPDDPSSDLLGQASSLVAFPLFQRGEPAGMVILLAPVPHVYDSTELSGLAIMGALLQRADRAWSLTRTLEAKCRELDAELAAAANVQRWLLPSATPPSPGLGVSVASSYRTAQRSGGDYYDAGELPDGQFGVVIADVSGHGAAAAVLMAILRTIVHDEVDRSRVVGPAALLDRAHERLCALGLPERGAFVTALSGSLNTADGEFTYSCAGHPPPRLVRSKSRTITSLAGASTLPLGILSERPARAEETAVLEPGDLIVFYSDGITEARSPTGEFFGTARLDRILRQLPSHATPHMAVDAITEAIRGFAGAGAPSDDQTLLAMRWRE